MSEDLDFDMEVVETDKVKDTSSDTNQKSSSTGGESEARKTETPSAKLWPSIPEDWEMVHGNEVYDANPTYYDADGEVDYIEMDALKTDLSDPKYVGRRDPSDYSGQMFAEGDTLFAQITPCTENGKAALVPQLRTEVGIGSTEFIVLSPDETKVHPRYLYYLSKSHPVHDYAVSRMRGSTGRQRVPVDVFRKELQIPLPPLPEQRKIASVLYAVDQAIQKTEAIIDQAKRVKRGLMQDLFQEGPNPEKSDSEETRFGPVLTRSPTHWDRSKIGDLYSEYQLGTAERGSTEDRRQIPLIKMGNLDFGTWDFSEVEMIDYDKELLETYRLQKGDLLFNTRNTPELVGKTAVWDSQKDAIYDNNLLRLRFDDRIDSGHYVNYYLSSGIGRRQLRARVHGTTSVAAIYQSDLEQVKIPLPPLDEQRQIVQKLRGVDRLVERNSVVHDELKRLKKGLMQDLLTGEVRTADKAIEVLDEVSAHE